MTPEDLDDRFDEAMRAVRRGDEAAAEAIIDEIAATDAALGHVARAEQAYRRRDMESFRSWVQKADAAVKPDNLPTLYRLSRLYAKGVVSNDYPADRRRQEAYLEQAATLGHALAQFELAVLGDKGDSVIEPDEARFERWIRRAVGSGSLLAAKYWARRAIERDTAVPQEARELLALVSDTDPDAAQLLGGRSG